MSLKMLIERIGRGFFLPITGLKIIFQSSKLMRWALAPVLVALLSLLLLVLPALVYAFSNLPILIDAVLSFGLLILGESARSADTVASWLHWIVGLLLIPVVLVASGLGAYIGVRLLMSPLYSMIADCALRDRADLRLPADSVWPGWVPTLRLVQTGLTKSVVFLIVGFVLMALSFVPGFAPIASLGIVTMIAYDALDFSYDCMLWNFMQRWRHFNRHRLEVAGFALILAIMSFAPGLVLVLFPALVVGASTLISSDCSADSSPDIEASKKRGPIEC